MTPRRHVPRNLVRAFVEHGVMASWNASALGGINDNDRSQEIRSRTRTGARRRPYPRAACGRPAVGGSWRRGARGVGAALLPVVRARALRVAARRRRGGVRAGTGPGGARPRLAARPRGSTRGRRVRLRDHTGDGDRGGGRDPALAGGDPAGGALVPDPSRRLAPAPAARWAADPRRGGGPLPRH